MSSKAWGAAVALALSAILGLSGFAQAGVEWTRVQASSIDRPHDKAW